MLEFRFNFHWNLFLWVQLTINQHWFRQWLVACSAPIHYLNQWWPSSPTHICCARGRWVKAPNQTWTNVNFSLVSFCGIHLRAISWQMPQLLFCIISLKDKLLTSLPMRGPGANVLTIYMLMPLFHWPAMPLRSYDVRKNEHIRSKIAEMVWWNISGATISHVLRFNCISMANVWCTCGAYGAWMAMPLRMMSRMRTWILRVHGASGVCIAYISSTRGGQLDSTVYGGRMYSAWAAYTRRTSKYTSFYSCGNVSKCLSCGCEIWMSSWISKSG